MLQAPCYSQPLVYGHSHFKKFWLRQTESEDDPSVAGQHGTSCLQKFNTLSAPMSSSMAGSVSGQNSVPGAKASLAVCANSFSAPRVSPAHELSGSSFKRKSDYNQSEDSSEASAVDCTLSLGTIKRDGGDVLTGLSRSGSPAVDVRKPSRLFQSESQWQPVMVDTHVDLLNNRPSDSIRDIFPQSSLPTFHSRALGMTSLCGGKSRSHNGGKVTSNLSGTRSQETLSNPRKSYIYSLENHNTSDPVSRREASRLCRPVIVIPEVDASDRKYTDAFAATGTASPASIQSSVDGDELHFSQKSIDSELDNNGLSHTRNVGRTCTRCGTMKTPLWRNGPQGPKSLCNACGIRFKKASKRHLNNGNSSDLMDSVPSSPASVKLHPTKSSKRKTECTITASMEVGRRAMGSETTSKLWKRNRLSGRGAVESSGSEVDEAVGSSGTSCVTWQRRTSSSACIIPELSIPSSDAGPSSSLSRFFPANDLPYRDKDNSKGVGERTMRFAQDEEEGAKLLMALSCGLVNAY